MGQDQAFLEEGYETGAACSEMVYLDGDVDENHGLGIDRRRGGNLSCLSDPPS